MRDSTAQAKSMQPGRVCAVLLLLAWPPASAVAAQPPAMPTFADTVDVRVVNLEVVVTRGGDRVGGLSAADFELRVDGERVPVDYFTEVREGRAVTPAGAAAVPSLAPGAGVATRYLVFIDDFFALPSHRNRVLRNLRDQLPRLASTDAMAVVAFDGRRIELLSPWTRSPAELAAALDRAMERTAYGLRRRSELRRLEGPHGLGRVGIAPSTSFSSIGFLGSEYGAAAPELQGGQEITARISQAVRAAAATLRGFAEAPGRKVMLLLSGGWPAFTVDSAEPLAGGGWAGGARVAALRDRFDVLEPLVDTANRLGYTLYPVDLQPEAAGRLHGAEHGSAAAARAEAARSEVLLDASRDALFYLAEATGGRSFEGAASLRALAGTVADTRSYYWLGFAPRWRGDDETHRLDVKALSKGLRVRGRADFTDLSPSGEVALMVEGAQLFDRPLPGDGELAAELGRPRRSGRDRVRLPLRLRIPLDKITLLPRGSGYAADLELRVAARDDEGFPADIPSVAVEIERDAAPAAGEVEVREIELKLRARPHRLVVALYQPATGSFLSDRLELEL